MAATPCGYTCEQHLRPPPHQAAPTSEQETIKCLLEAASASPSHPWSDLSSEKSSRESRSSQHEQLLPLGIFRLVAVVPADQRRLQAGHERVGGPEREDVLPLEQPRFRVRPVPVRDGRRRQRRQLIRPGESDHAEPKRPPGILPGEGALSGVRQRQTGATDPRLVPEADPHRQGLQQVRGDHQRPAEKGDPDPKQRLLLSAGLRIIFNVYQI